MNHTIEDQLILLRMVARGRLGTIHADATDYNIMLVRTKLAHITLKRSNARTRGSVATVREQE